jgi:alcohol dehydrogenase
MNGGRWDMCATPRIVFGPGTLNDLPGIVAAQRVLLVTSQGFTKRGVTAKIQDLFGSRLIGVMDRVGSNPDLDQLNDETPALKALAADALLAIGGGSAIDAAKALSVALAAPADWTLRKHFDHGAKMPSGPLVPIYAVATTAGTGAEVTPFGTLWDRRNLKKLSIADPRVLPRAAILDPALTTSLPEDVTVSTGLDAVSQGLESIWNLYATPVTISWAIQSLRLSLPALPKLIKDPTNLRLRSDMLAASMLAGLAIAHSRTALAHSMSYPLTSHFDVPHGLACSFTLPAILAFTAEADDGRLIDAARALGFRSIHEFQQVLTSLLHQLSMRERLTAYVPNLKDMHNVSDEMYLPARAGNLMRNADLATIRILLEQSIESL